MLHAPEITMVIEACTVEGRQERLDSLLTSLEMCEKALQVRSLCLHIGVLNVGHTRLRQGLHTHADQPKHVWQCVSVTAGADLAECRLHIMKAQA